MGIDVKMVRYEKSRKDACAYLQVEAGVGVGAAETIRYPLTERRQLRFQVTTRSFRPCLINLGSRSHSGASNATKKKAVRKVGCTKRSSLETTT